MDRSILDEREKRWRLLIVRFDRRLRCYLRSAHLGDDAVEDLLWDVWQVAVEHEPELLNAEDPWTFLQAIGRGLCRTRVRIARSEIRGVNDFASLAPTTDSWDRSLPKSVSAWLVDAMRRLPTQQRLAITYRFENGWSYRAIATVLGSAEPTVRVHAMRGISRLRDSARRAGVVWP